VNTAYKYSTKQQNGNREFAYKRNQVLLRKKGSVSHHVKINSDYRRISENSEAQQGGRARPSIKVHSWRVENERSKHINWLMCMAYGSIFFNIN
jgi:hypothetical protein